MAQDRQIRVLVAATEPLFRDGLARSVRRDPNLQLVAELEGDAGVLDAIRRLSPDVAVVDADAAAFRLIDAVVQQALTTRIVLLTPDLWPDIAFEAVGAGAHGCLSKRVKPDAVCDAIRRVADGAVVLCEEAQNAIAGEIRLRHADERQLLAPRELEVLRLVADGLNNVEIARRLHIARSTVKSTLARIFARLGVRDRTGAAVEATRRGLLD